jgi:hypothetical protein
MAIRPTPTQAENDQAKIQPYVMNKTADGSAADVGSPGGGASATLPGPVFDTITPTGGPQAGTNITCDGSGFNVNCKVKVGATIVTATSLVSGNRVTARITAGAAGAQNVVVRDTVKGVDSSIKVFTFS